MDCLKYDYRYFVREQKLSLTANSEANMMNQYSKGRFRGAFARVFSR